MGVPRAWQQALPWHTADSRSESVPPLLPTLPSSLPSPESCPTPEGSLQNANLCDSLSQFAPVPCPLASSGKHEDVTPEEGPHDLQPTNPSSLVPLLLFPTHACSVLAHGPRSGPFTLSRDTLHLHALLCLQPPGIPRQVSTRSPTSCAHLHCTLPCTVMTAFLPVSLMTSTNMMS